MTLDIVLARRLGDQDDAAAPESPTAAASGEAWPMPAGLEGLV